MTDPKIRDALRMMGHLLETNGTTGSKARTESGRPIGYDCNNACEWCLVGAIDVVFDTLFGETSYIPNRYKLVENYLGLPSNKMSLVDAWERHSASKGPAARKAIVEKLKNA